MTRHRLLILSLCGFMAALIFTSTLSASSGANDRLDLISETTSVFQDSSAMGEYDFDLYNDTGGWVLNGFFTREDGKWSKNWLSAKVQPGKRVHMVWSAASNEGDCVVPFATSWDGYTEYEQHTIDWCKRPIKAVHLLDDAKLKIDYK